MLSTTTKVGHGLAKVLGIKLDHRHDLAEEKWTQGEFIYSVSSADPYVETEPTSWEWIQDTVPTWHNMASYVLSLFPFMNWITRYNYQWFHGDMVAGITVGAVVVPQSMAYAVLAQLPPEYGLYSSFMGVLTYWFFATSKDITIGPVAVASTMVGNIVIKAREREPDIAAELVASAVAVMAGCIIASIGLIRCGWIVEFISLTAMSAFMTGSALNIAVGQVPGLMGITGFSTREATYKVVINTLKNLGRTKIDAAMGLTALTMLYLIRYGCTYASRRMPARSKIFFFLATLRTAFVILLYTMISWLVNRNRRGKPLVRILGNVPRGFKHARVPQMDQRILNAFMSELPATVMVLLIEHIALAKSFGRINNYTIHPSQELVALGMTNILGPFLGAYPATGSFSRTAIQSKAGVRTPFAGFITAVVVLLAIYALPAMFFYIPSAGLSAVIIHAVGDLITPPNVIYQYWRASPFEVVVFFAGVIVTVFTNIENGIYTTVAISAAVLLFRVVKAKGRFLGRVKVYSVVGDHVGSDKEEENGSGGKYGTLSKQTPSLPPNDLDTSPRDLFLPIDHQDGSNPIVDLDSPYPGIFIYRFSEGFNYPNANHYLDYLAETVMKQTRRTNTEQYQKLGDRPWNDPGPRRGKMVETRMDLPTLKAVILDFSSVNNVDITSIQILIDVRNQLHRWAAPDTVEWHFAHLNNRWTKRALVSAGFGYPVPPAADAPGLSRWKPIFSVTEIGGVDSAAIGCLSLSSGHSKDNNAIEEGRREHSSGSRSDRNGVKELSISDYPHARGEGYYDGGEVNKSIQEEKRGKQKVALVHGINRPLFHMDLTSALQAAISNAEWRAAEAMKGPESDGDGEGPTST
ncbi:MAG: nuclear mRNA export, poly(A)+RNA binding protein [Watsoniomyces obsoletus]|nr:MAG: nuclear mRNA export, poly(A)+RNA binding protein [Watsoniomyces obsoletus]